MGSSRQSLIRWFLRVLISLKLEPTHVRQTSSFQPSGFGGRETPDLPRLNQGERELCLSHCRGLQDTFFSPLYSQQQSHLLAGTKPLRCQQSGQGLVSSHQPWRVSAQFPLAKTACPFSVPFSHLGTKVISSKQKPLKTLSDTSVNHYVSPEF